MARIRTIKPDFFFDVDLAKLGTYSRLLFIGLWCLADREGRLEDCPQKIKAQVFPYDSVDGDMFLAELYNAGFIVRYSVSDREFIQITNFKKHQRTHPKEPESNIPCADSEGAVKKNGEKCFSGMLPVESGGKGREGKGRSTDGKESRVPDNRPSAFVRPTLDELKAYCSERNSKVDPERFFNYYESNGWMVGRNKMKNWKAAVRTWEKNENGQGYAPAGPKRIVGEAAPVPGKYDHLG